MRTTWLILALALLAVSRAGAGTITYWEEERPEIRTILDRFSREFERANPGIKVRRSHFGTEDLRMQFQTATLGGGGPDLLLAPHDFAGVFAAMGTIQPVDGFGDLERFDAALMAAITDKGQRWGVPLNKGNHLILFYNKKLVPTPPATLEALIKAGESLTNRKVPRYGLAFHALEPYWFAPFLGCFGSWPLVDRRPNLDNEAMTKALTLVHDLRYKFRIIPDTCDYACAETLFVEGKAAMTINGDWAISKFAERWKDDLGIAPLPSLAATGKPMTPMSGGKIYLFRASLKKGALADARAFVDFMTSADVQRRLAIESKRLPSLARLATDPKITADKLLAQSAAAAVNARPMPMQVEMRAVWDAIRPQLQEVMADRVTPREAARSMQKDAITKIQALRQ